MVLGARDRAGMDDLWEWKWKWKRRWKRGEAMLDDANMRSKKLTLPLEVSNIIANGDSQPKWLCNSSLDREK